VARRGNLIWSLAGLATAGLLVALLIGGEKYLEHQFSSGRDFDSAEWLAWGREATSCFDGNSPRLEMVDDLRTNHLRIGMRRASVIKRLGPPDYKWSARELEYALGGDIDCEYLEVSFNKRGTLKLVERLQG